MYTQCPECQIAFRVTATVLQQAKGRVRCGGCGHAFSALDYLTEEMPDQLDAGPEPAADTSDEDFAAQSQRLLQTLEELAGPGDVKIEDTGVEWQVVTDGSIDPNEVPRVTEQFNADPDDTQHNLSLVGASAPVDEPRYDDNTPLPDDFEDADHVPYTPPVDRPRRRTSDHVEPVSPEFLDKQGDFALMEPNEWTDILDEVGVANALEAGADEEGASPAVDAAPPDDITEADADTAAQDDDGLAVQAVPEPEDLAAFATAEDAEEFVHFFLDDEELSDDEAADVEEPAEDQPPAEEPQPVTHFDSTAVFEEQIAVARDALSRGEFEEPDDGEEADQEEDLSVASIIEDLPHPEVLDAHEDPDVPTTDEEHLVPPASESEETINKEIDQQLLLASTHDKLLVKTIAGDKFDFDEKDLNVETIVMEGDIVGDAIEAGEVEGRNHEDHEQDGEESLLDTYMLNRGKAGSGRRRTDPPGARVYVAIVLLGVALLAQILHASRESLATFGMFNQTVGPVYRALGRPITPDWDIKGWQFEATNGSTDDSGQQLTILSRLVNQSQQALPYPLVHVSLTDRWEEVIGSRVLEPGEYLAGDADPSRPLAPGERFTAAITIDSPSDAATGFKLNVCYRVVPGEVRCAIEDFKN